MWELLGAYEACDSHEDHFFEWTEMVGLDRHNDAHYEAYVVIHNAYVDVWKEIDSEEFFTLIDAAANVWRERRASEKTGKTSLVARIRRAA